jgi:transcriptional regulator with XRE-family HTH domain
MTDLRQLLAHNMKERRRSLKMSQYRLAELADTSPYYIGMIENQKKYPSPEMMRRIAAGLEIDTPELFSMASYPVNTLRKYQQEILTLIGDAANKVISERLARFQRRK